MRTNIVVSTNAWKKMTEIIKQSNNKYGFIYSASSGGCNGFNFVLELLDEKIYDTISKNKYLTVLTNKDVKLYVEPHSEMHLLGTSINYITEDYTKGQFENKFVFDVNKDLMTTCGCGTSFTPKG